MENRITMVLIMEQGPQPGTKYPLRGERITMGRAPANTVVINDSRISRYHAQIRIMPGGAVLEDVGSTNGTFVNGVRLSSSHLLSPGEVIGLADTIKLRFATKKYADVGPDIMPDVPPPPTSTAPSGEDARAFGAPPAPPAEVLETPPPPIDAGWSPPPPPQDVGSEADSLETEAPVSTPAAETLDTQAPAGRSRSFYIVVGCLVILILLCIALAAYLWFEPIQFLKLLGIPVP